MLSVRHAFHATLTHWHIFCLHNKKCVLSKKNAKSKLYERERKQEYRRTVEEQ